MIFFTRDDLDLLVRQAGQTYNKNDVAHRDIGQQLRHGVVGKTKHLAQLVLREVQELGYQVELRHHWHDVDRRTDIPIFKPYTWASFTKPDAGTNHIYFTLGVDGTAGELVIKLDYQRKDPPGRPRQPNLTFEQRTALQNFLDAEGEGDVGWHTVQPTALSGYDWTSLGQWAADFIRANNRLYDEAVRVIQLGATAPQWGGTPPPADEAERRRASYLLEARQVDPADNHYAMSMALWRQLRDLCGTRNVATESPTGYRTRIDLEVRHSATDARILFELKSGDGPGSLRPAVREALGQLIEYAYWPGKPAPVRALVIATPNPPTAELLRFLNRIALPNDVRLEYLQVNASSGADAAELLALMRRYNFIDPA
jgi:hypothetical protein